MPEYLYQGGAGTFRGEVSIPPVDVKVLELGLSQVDRRVPAE